MAPVKYLLFFYFFPLVIQAQADEILWFKQFDTSTGCGVEQVLMTDSQVFVTIQFQGNLELGDTSLQSGGLFDIALLCYNISGELQWILQAGSNDTDQTSALELSPDGRLIWTGLFWDELRLGTEKYLVTVASRAIFIASVDISNGDVIWCNLLQGEGIKESLTIACDLSGNVLLGGFFNVSLFVDSIGIQSTSGNAGYFVIFNPAGRLNQHFVTEGTGFGKILTAIMTEDRIYISGTYSGNVILSNEILSGPLLDTDIFLAAFDKEGLLIWLNTARGILEDTVIDLHLTDENQILMAGNFSGRLLFGLGLELQSMGFASDIFAAKYDLNGNAQEIFQISNPGNDVLMSLRNSGNGWILSGTFDREFQWEDQTFQTSAGSRSGFVLHLDRELESTISLNIAASEGFLGRSITDAEGEISVTGISIPEVTTFLDQEFFADGIYQGVLIVYKNRTNTVTEQEKDFLTFRVYPNPAGKFIHVESLNIDRIILTTLNGYAVGSWNESAIHLPELMNGHYILTVLMKNGSKQSKLIQIIN